MNIEITEAKSYHVGQIVRRMRKGHASAISALGINAHRDLRGVFDNSVYRRAAFVNGRLEAVWGVTGMMASSSGHVWFVLSEEGERHPLTVAVGARKELEVLMVTRTELTTTIFDGDEAAFRFALLFGFRPFERSHGMTWMRLRRGVPISKVVKPPEAPFLIFGLPRSRTTWLSEFLSYGESACMHDAMLEADGFDGMAKLLSRPGMGICETGFVMAWPVLKRYFPKARFMVVKRSVEDVRAELLTHRWEFMPGHLEWMNYRLDEISALPGTLTVTFDALNREEVCKEVFEHCLQQPFDRAWWLYWRDKNVQIDMRARMKRLIERKPNMDALIQDCEDLMSPVTFQTEPWANLAKDGSPLFAEHYAEVGSFNGMGFNPNVGRAQALDNLGMLQITTARAGNKLIGYIFFVIDPNLEDQDTLGAVQASYFVTKAFRGVGLKMRENAKQALRSRGVEVISMSAGVRGDGSRLAKIYQREGAIEERRVFSLRIA